jgi:2-amino-4-hydroxy-6-hydroxymethyldihydropteridine diphosphokinase
MIPNNNKAQIHNKSQNICYLGLGGNLNNPLQTIKAAIKDLASLPNIQLLQHSSFYQTKPFGFLEQPDFINAVAKIATTLTPTVLLKTMLNLELKYGRIRGPQKNMPRTLDIDLLFFNRRHMKTRHLQLPHPGIASRNSVLLPLYELAPHLVKHALGATKFIEKFSLVSNPFFQNDAQRILATDF